MNLSLTEKQTRILTLIRKSWVDFGYSPTRKELSDGYYLKWKVTFSRQAIDRHLFALKKKNYIIIDRKKGRRNIKIKNIKI